MEGVLDKREARRFGKIARMALSADDQTEFDHRIVQSCQRTLDWGRVQRISLFRAIAGRGEVELSELEDWLAREWPETTVRIEPVTAFRDDGSQFDVVLVPLLAFDDNGHRAGYGSGYYDQFLATQRRALAVGVAYETQRVQEIETEAHDQRLDAVVTERGWRWFGEVANALVLER